MKITIDGVEKEVLYSRFFPIKCGNCGKWLAVTYDGQWAPEMRQKMFPGLMFCDDRCAIDYQDRNMRSIHEQDGAQS